MKNNYLCNECGWQGIDAIDLCHCPACGADLDCEEYEREQDDEKDWNKGED